MSGAHIDGRYPRNVSTVNPSAKPAYHHGNLRAEMIRLATEMSAQTGLDSVSVREVARQAGVSSSAAYRHFSSRDELLECVRRNVLEELSERMAQELGSVAEADPRLRVRAAGRAYVAFAVEAPLLFGSMSSGFPAPEGQWDGTPLGDLSALVRDAVPEAEGGAVEARSVALWSLVHGFAILCTQGGLRELAPRRREELLEEVLALGVRGLRSDGD